MIKVKTRGQGLVEFALILPVLMLILLGIAEGAHVIQSYIAAQNAVRDAARYAVSGKPLNASGDPWTMLPEQRKELIKQQAINRSVGTAYTRVITDVTQYDTFLDRATCDVTCAGVLGIRVDWIQYDVTGATQIVQADHPGIEGSDVQVSLYHNVALFDPIYAAIVPNGYFTIQASIVMRNEGGKPITGAAPPFQGGSGGSPGSGSGGASTNPVIEIQDGSSHPAGETIYIRVRMHNPNASYNVLVNNVLVGPVTTDPQGNAIIPYTIPQNKPVGSYTVESQTPGGTQVAVTLLTVTQPTQPTIITNGDILPFGSVLTYSLTTHAALTNYNIDLTYNGSTTANLNPLSTDANGVSVFPAGYESYTIPNNGSLAEGSYVIRSTLTSSVVASRTLTFQQGCIKINQGACGETITTPNGVYLNILIQKHAPNRSYIIKLHNAGTGTDTILNPSETTDAFGSIYLVYALPDTMADGNYAVQTEDAEYPGAVIAQTPLIVSTPPAPYIAVVGGYRWPAGSAINFQLRNHTSGAQYDIYWEGQLIISNAAPTDGHGAIDLQYTIPISTPQAFTYTLQSIPHDTTGAYTAQSPNIEVIPQPFLRIAEGNTQIPGTPVTVELLTHNINSRYFVYVEEEGSTAPGRALPLNPVTTNGIGYATIPYNIPVNLSSGSVVTVTSYLDSQSPNVPTAQTVINILTADLQIVSIETPLKPAFNSAIPVTVTIKNAAPVTITNKSFDVDLYMDPPAQPDLGRALPPGDQKVWLSPPLGYNQTRTFTTTIPLYGAFDHTLWARVDTSNRVPEGNPNCLTNPLSKECNNIASTTIQPSTCEIQYVNQKTDPSQTLVNWNTIGFGNTTMSGTPFAVNGDVMTLHNNGSSTVKSDDDNGGYQLAYHQVSGNFDVRVRALTQSKYDNDSSLSSWAKFGLEVRGDLASDADKLNWTHTKAHKLQYLSRTNGSVKVNSNIGDSDLPVWLRINRNGDTFTLYYSYDTTNPPTNWTVGKTVTLANMPSSIYLGVINASYSSSKKNTVTLDGYQVCVNPAGAASCGEVREAGGLVVLNATNITTKSSGSVQWQTTTRNGKVGYWIPNGSGNYYTFNPNAPELKYQIDVTNSGRYYVWALGYAPNGSGNSAFIGLSGATPSDNLTQGTTGAMAWTNTGQSSGSGYYIDINTVGTVDLSVWAREDGYELYQILLTTDANFVPDINTDYTQSQCSGAGESSDPPPGLLQCTSAVVNGDFEDDTLMSAWGYAGITEQVTRTSLPHYFGAGQSFSMLLPDTNVYGLPRHPYLYQDFTMPTWVLTPTTTGGTSLNLTLHAAVNPEGSPNPDPLFASVQNQTGQTITNYSPITVTTGNLPPYIDPNNPNPDNSEWVQKKLNLADGFNNPADLLNFTGQPLRLYFNAPNPNNTDSTRFYVDNIDLQVCTQQPTPTSFNTKIAGDVRVFLNGVPTPKPGVFVWIYAIDGTMAKTYTIQDSTFSFYDLPASPGGTQYVLYAEYWENNTFYSASTVLILTPGQIIDNISLLLF